MKRIDNIKNLKVYNKCKEAILSGISLIKHAEYTLGKTLFATTDIGKYRKNQEDSVLIVEHPINKNIKLIGVSDGVGGASNGEFASNHIVKKLMLWFESLDESLFDNMNDVKDELYRMLYFIMDDFEKFYGAATLSAAIIGKNETLIVNIGDSRVYTYKKGRLKQETKDDSIVQELYDEEAIPSKELMRFHKKSNQITQNIDPNPNNYFPNIKIIKNNTYDRIYAFTDGVTDCLSKKELENIIKKSKYEATHSIVKNALENDSYLWEEIDKLPRKERDLAYELYEIIEEEYWQDIEGGKDNTSAVEYRKK